jgi:mono/diheme cytochrome c family protein
MLSVAAPLRAADSGEIREATLEKGRAIAEANCSPCHAVGLTDESPTRVNANTAFRILHERYPIPMLDEAAKTGSISGHDEMPGFDYSLEDARALLAYIDSLAPDKPGYVPRPDGR